MSTQDLEARVKKIEEGTAAREKEAELAKARAEGERESLRFLQEHVKDFLQCEANINLMKEAMKGKDWTLENLNKCFTELGDRLAKPGAPEPKEQKEPTEEKWPHPWPKEWASKEALLKSNAADYKSFYYSRKYGEAFRAWVNQILGAAQ